MPFAAVLVGQSGCGRGHGLATRSVVACRVSGVTGRPRARAIPALPPVPAQGYFGGAVQLPVRDTQHTLLETARDGLGPVG